MKSFEIFKKECEFWIDKLHIDNWGVEYTHSKKGDGKDHANIAYASTEMKARITFYSENCKDKTIEGIKETAKHEIMHLLIGRFATIAEKRFIRDDELTQAEEELVQKLLRVIK